MRRYVDMWMCDVNFLISISIDLDYLDGLSGNER